MNMMIYFNFYSYYIIYMAGYETKTFSKHDDYMTPKSAWENIKQYILIMLALVIVLWIFSINRLGTMFNQLTKKSD